MFRENFPLTKEDHFLIGVFIMLYFSHESRISTWNFIKQNWDKIQSRCAGGHQKARLVGLSSFRTTHKLHIVVTRVS